MWAISDKRALFLRLFFASICIRPATGAFSITTNFFAGIIQQNNQSTWCYFPTAGLTRALSCVGDYAAVLTVHLSQTTSIGYYGPDGTRFGGIEWRVPLENTPRIFLCTSGRCGDGTYQTYCGTPVQADNAFAQQYSEQVCLVAIAQPVVVDGCYTPLQAAALPPSTVPTSVATNPTTTSLESSTSITRNPNPSTTPSSVRSSSSKTSVTSSPSPSVIVQPNNSSGGGLSKSDIISIVFGVVAFVGVAFGILKWAMRRHKEP